MSAPSSTLPDRLGIAFSGLCAVHCLGLPVALAFAPVLASGALGTLAGSEWAHAVLLVPVALVSGTVLGRCTMEKPWFAALLVPALLAMTGALFVDEEWIERALTMIGASLLVFAHGVNLHARRARRSPA